MVSLKSYGKYRNGSGQEEESWIMILAMCAMVALAVVAVGLIVVSSERTGTGRKVKETDTRMAEFRHHLDTMGGYTIEKIRRWDEAEGNGVLSLPMSIVEERMRSISEGEEGSLVRFALYAFESALDRLQTRLERVGQDDGVVMVVHAVPRWCVLLPRQGLFSLRHQFCAALRVACNETHRVRCTTDDHSAVSATSAVQSEAAEDFARAAERAADPRAWTGQHADFRTYYTPHLATTRVLIGFPKSGTTLAAQVLLHAMGVVLVGPRMMGEIVTTREWHMLMNADNGHVQEVVSFSSSGLRSVKRWPRGSQLETSLPHLIRRLFPLATEG